jgi:hypothetical protein
MKTKIVIWNFLWSLRYIKESKTETKHQVYDKIRSSINLRAKGYALHEYIQGQTQKKTQDLFG